MTSMKITETGGEIYGKAGIVYFDILRGEGGDVEYGYMEVCVHLN
jgi:hypothetical protein